MFKKQFIAMAIGGLLLPGSPRAIFSVEAAQTAKSDRRQGERQQGERYVCPMDADVTSDKPGTCPKCGMALRPASEVAGEDGSSSEAARDDSDTPSLSLKRIQNLAVYDQNGTKLDFYNDLVKGRTVAIDFIFTTCTTICPSLTATMRRVQQSLDQQGTRVQLISISVDPVTDTPERLREFAKKFNAGPGWSFVTGKKSDIDVLLQAMGAAVSLREDHTPMMLVGNDVRGKWTRAYGLSSPAKLVKVISEFADQKAP